MLAKSISLSRKVNRLSLKSAFIYTWAMSHTDDWGLISSDPTVIKATVFPMKKEIRASDIESFILEAQEKDANGESLISEYQECLEFNAFDEHQTLSPEKRAKPRFQKVPLESPRIPRESQENPIQEKRREVKGSEEKLRTKSAHKDFIDWYFKTCSASRNVSVQITAAAAKNLQSALKKQSFEELQKRAVYYLCHPSFKEFSPGLETFLSAGVQNGIANKAKNGEEYWKDLERFSSRFIAPQVDRLTAIRAEAAKKTTFTSNV